MIDISPSVLIGPKLQLEPLNPSHKNALYEAAQDESIWTYFSSKVTGEHFYRWFDKAMQHLQNAQHLPFIVRRLSDNKIIGSTRYYDINTDHHRVAIGYTWYVPEVWGTHVNPECKFLLLKFAFEDLNINRVEFLIHSRNMRSRAAVKKLGAIEEGTLRHHMILDDGSLRDTVIYSIIKPDWPQIKSSLINRIKNYNRHADIGNAYEISLN